MTAAQEHEELHHLVDRLSPAQARHLLLVVADDPELAEVAAPREPDNLRPPGRRRLSFIGTLEAEPDLAERSAELVREGLGSPE